MRGTIRVLVLGTGHMGSAVGRPGGEAGPGDGRRLRQTGRVRRLDRGRVMGPDRDLGVGTTPDLDATIERTRCASELAAYDQGANVSYLGPSGTQAEDRMHTIKAVPVPTLGG